MRATRKVYMAKQAAFWFRLMSLAAEPWCHHLGTETDHVRTFLIYGED